MSTISRSINTFIALALAATISGSLPALAVANTNSTTRGNSEAARANAEVKKNDNQPSANGAIKSLAAQQNACNKVRASIANRTANLQEAGKRHLAVIDKVYTNLTTFNGKEGLTLIDTDHSLVSDAKKRATDAVFTLGQNEDKLSCEDANVGQMAATVRLNVQDVNAALKEYREAVEGAINHTRQQLNNEGAE